MGDEKFINKCKEIVRKYEISHLDKSDVIPELRFSLYGAVKYYKTIKHC